MTIYLIWLTCLVAMVITRLIWIDFPRVNMATKERYQGNEWLTVLTMLGFCIFVGVRGGRVPTHLRIVYIFNSNNFQKESSRYIGRFLMQLVMSDRQLIHFRF